MSVRTTLYPGIFIKLLRIPQGIWYSHSSLPISLRLATKIADFVFTSVPGSTSINSNKLRYIGHGIDFTNYPDIDEVLKIQKEGIVSLGRIAPIKNLEKIVQAGENEVGFPGITFIGPTESATTLTKELEILASKKRVSLSFIPTIPHEYVPDYLLKYSLYYSGTPKSVDKSTLEAASVGCLVITSEAPARELTGMNNVWTKLGHDLEIEIKDQIKVMGSISAHELLTIRRYVMEFTRAGNDVVNTTKKIVEQLRELR
jgi:glycosyltransferase involved in cell wall biosynthesis